MTSDVVLPVVDGTDDFCGRNFGVRRRISCHEVLAACGLADVAGTTVTASDRTFVRVRLGMPVSPA